MIGHGATIPYQRPPFIYGEILSRSMYETGSSVQSPRPGIGRFLSQGMAAGTVISFLLPAVYILAHPTNGYNFFLMFALPFYLAVASVVGFVQGLAIWGCTRLAGRDLGWASRAAINVSISAIMLGVLYLLLYPGPPEANPLELKDYLSLIGTSIASGVTYGLMIGSRLQPWRALVRGAKSLPARSWLVTGITGLVLRVLIIFFLMESILSIVCLLQQDFDLRHHVAPLIVLTHFAAALLIVSIRFPFWLLLPLAVIINFPVVTFLTDIKDGDLFMLYLTISYLVAWAAFLLTRCRLTYSALAFINQEIRYYLID